MDNAAAKAKIRELLGQQYQDGHTNHYYFPHEGWEPLRRLHSDNHIWPILGVWNAVMEDGSTDFLQEKVAFFDGEEDTVYGHLCRSVAFVKSHLGANGFPLMLTSDWNDMLYKVCREGKGESIWMAMFLGYALPKLAELARLLGKEEDSREFMALWREQQQLVSTKAWDGRWFRRATMDNGEYLGTETADEAKIWLNAQSWSVISGMPERDKMVRAMDSVRELLDTELGIRKIHPPIVNFPSPDDPLSHYNKGCGENGAIFCHANTWAIMAECMLGRGDRAWKYYRQLIPAVAMAKASPWRYKAEPYVYASNFFGPESDRFGLANVSWLTGTASWMYVAATQFILGIRPAWEGLEIDPCLPADWTSASVTRTFRGPFIGSRSRSRRAFPKARKRVSPPPCSRRHGRLPCHPGARRGFAVRGSRRDRRGRSRLDGSHRRLAPRRAEASLSRRAAPPGRHTHQPAPVRRQSVPSDRSHRDRPRLPISLRFSLLRRFRGCRDRLPATGSIHRIEIRYKFRCTVVFTHA